MKKEKIPAKEWEAVKRALEKAQATELLADLPNSNTSVK